MPSFRLFARCHVSLGTSRVFPTACAWTAGQFSSARASTGGRIEPPPTELYSALKPRMADTNRNLAAHAIRICARLATAIGPSFVNTGRQLLSPILRNVSDAKPAVRAAVAEFVTAYVVACGWSALDAPLTAVLSSPKCAGIGKSTVLECLTALVQGSKRVPKSAADVSVVVQTCGFGLADKGITPRQQATVLLAALLATEGGLAHASAAAAKLPVGQAPLVNEVLSKAGVATGVRTAASAPAPVAHRLAAASDDLHRVGTAPGEGLSVRLSATSVPSGDISRSVSTQPARPGTAPVSQAACVAPADDSTVLIAMVDAAEKDRRIVPPRSFKFEMRATEAADVKKELIPHVRPALAVLMFSKDWHNHCAAAERLQVQCYAALHGLLHRAASMRIVPRSMMCWLNTSGVAEDARHVTMDPC